MKFNNKSILIRSENVNSFPIHNGIYVHQLENDEFFTLEEGVSTYIWTQLDGKKSLNQIFMEVAKLCRVSIHDIENDLTQFVEELVDAEMVNIKLE